MPGAYPGNRDSLKPREGQRATACNWGATLLRHTKEETANPGRGKTEGENKELAWAGSGRQLQANFNFVLSWEHQEPGLFMVPVRWKEGGKKRGREGLPLS